MVDSATVRGENFGVLALGVSDFDFAGRARRSVV
jgi:hypothetical protein